MPKWARCQFDDALHLLSSAFCANSIFNGKNNNRRPINVMLKIRKYAVERLKEDTTNEQITSILLQLVQALRYEPFDYAESALAKFLVERACRDSSVATLIHWYLYVEAEVVDETNSSSSNSSSRKGN